MFEMVMQSLCLLTKYLVAASNSWIACMPWHGRKHENNTKAQSKREQAVLLKHHMKHAKVRKTNNNNDNNSSNGDDDVAQKKEETVLFDPLLKYHLTFVGIPNLCIYTIYFSRRSTRVAHFPYCSLLRSCFPVPCMEVCVCVCVLVACNGKCFYTKMYIYIVCRVFSYAFIFGSCFAPIPSALSPNGWMDGWLASDNGRIVGLGWVGLGRVWVGFWLAVFLCVASGSHCCLSFTVENIKSENNKQHA